MEFSLLLLMMMLLELSPRGVVRDGFELLSLLVVVDDGANLFNFVVAVVVGAVVIVVDFGGGTAIELKVVDIRNDATDKLSPLFNNLSLPPPPLLPIVISPP